MVSSRPSHTQRELLKKSFIEYFKASGFKYFPPAPLIPIDDQSLLFTNSTIVPVKTILQKSQIRSPGFVFSQQCIRNHNLKEFKQTNSQLSYMSCFHMLGVLVDITFHEVDMLSLIINFLTSEQNIEMKRLVCLASSSRNFIRKAWEVSYSKQNLQLDSQPKSYYKWNYGLKDITGYGVTLALKHESGSLEDFGNIIALSHDKKIIGYEFGFGVETFLARKYSLHSPFEASSITNLIGYNSAPSWRKFQDCLVASVTINRLNILPGKGGRQYILKQYLRELLQSSIELTLTLDKLEEYLYIFDTYHYGDTKSAEYIISYLRKKQGLQEENYQKFVDYILNQKHLHIGKDSKKNLSPLLRKKIVWVADKRYNLSASLIHETICTYFPELNTNTEVRNHE